MDKVNRLADFAQIGGIILKNRVLQFTVACEDHGGIVGRVEPFMRVDGQAIGLLHASDKMTIGWRARGKIFSRLHMHAPREFILTVRALAANLCNNKQISRNCEGCRAISSP